MWRRFLVAVTCLTLLSSCGFVLRGDDTPAPTTDSPTGAAANEPPPITKLPPTITASPGGTPGNGAPGGGPRSSSTTDITVPIDGGPAVGLGPSYTPCHNLGAFLQLADRAVLQTRSESVRSMLDQAIAALRLAASGGADSVTGLALRVLARLQADVGNATPGETVSVLVAHLQLVLAIQPEVVKLRELRATCSADPRSEVTLPSRAGGG